MSKKALIVASVPGFIYSFEKNDIKILKELGFDVYILTNLLDSNYTSQVKSLKEDGFNLLHADFSRSPFSKKTFISYKQIKKLLLENKFDIIHCHTPAVSVLTRIVARKYRKKGTKVLYTAHGFHFCKGAPLLNWLIYYPFEKLCSYFTDVLITINNEDFELANKKMKAKTIKYIPGVGIDIKKFSNCDISLEEKRTELGFKNDDIILLSVGELSINKNHQIIIKAINELNNANIHYLIAGKGTEHKNLENLAKELNVNLHLLGYRKDIKELCYIADIFCFPSIREGLPVSLMEAIACKKACVVSNIRGNTDIIKTDVIDCLCNYNDCYKFANIIEKFCNDKNLIEKAGKFNFENIQNFDISNVEIKMREIYSEL